MYIIIIQWSRTYTQTFDIHKHAVYVLLLHEKAKHGIEKQSEHICLDIERYNYRYTIYEIVEILKRLT